MPTIELLAEIEELKEQLKIKQEELDAQPDLFAANALLRYELTRAAHMAALWKRCAKIKKYAIENVYEPQADMQLERICKEQTELTALKKDARDCAELAMSYMDCKDEDKCGGCGCGKTNLDNQCAARRILEATKEWK